MKLAAAAYPPSPPLPPLLPGLMLIDRNDELSVLFERAHALEARLKSGQIGLQQRENEVGRGCVSCEGVKGTKVRGDKGAGDKGMGGGAWGRAQAPRGELGRVGVGVGVGWELGGVPMPI